MMNDKQMKRFFVLILSMLNYGDTIAFTSTPFGMVRPTNVWTNPSASSLKTPLTMTGAGDELNPSTFREAEVLGLKYMQERKYKEALDGTSNEFFALSVVNSTNIVDTLYYFLCQLFINIHEFFFLRILISLAFKMGMTLPGSRTDIIRTKSLSGPSPVGGSTGGYESKFTTTLDEFELQAVQYNMACAYAQLNELDNAVNALQLAFENGFDNFATVKVDPDLDPIKSSASYEGLMAKYEPKSKGFNPFGIFGNK